jgi:protein subunit release factor B
LRKIRIWTKASSHIALSKEKFLCCPKMFCNRISVISLRLFSSIKKKVDYSLVPKLNESDIEENFIRGSGPGGQATNKTSNCVQIRHIPTNIIVKYHGTRVLSRNREEARSILLKKLDEFYNKENSVENQIKRIEKEKSLRRQYKNDKLRKMKEEFKLKNSSDENKP